MRALAGLCLATLALAPLASCAKQANACAGAPTGSCITLEVTGPGGLHIDKLDIVASGAFTGERTSSFASAEPLPVRVGVVPPTTSNSGQVMFTVTALLDGATVGVGSAVDTLGSDDRDLVKVPLVGVGGDGGVPTDGGDMSLGDGGTSCTPLADVACSADGTTLIKCNAAGDGTETDMVCPLGCAAAPKPRCKQLLPHLPATTFMINNAPPGMPTLAGSVIINTDTGEITGPASLVIRAASGDPSTASGIGYQTFGQSAVFTLTALTVPTNATVLVVGSRSLVVVAAQTITVSGLIDARPYAIFGSMETLCYNAVGGPGGFAGGFGVNLTGAGGGGGGPSGTAASYGPGGGGGGFGDKGGNGGAGDTGGALTTAINGGAEVMLAYPIVGGSGGGGGATGTTSTPEGGGGGGAVQLVAGMSVVIGESGGAPALFEGVNVSGCGGNASLTAGATIQAGGGGGGGGTILIESPVVTVFGDGSLVAEGGGGGGAMNGNTATLSVSVAMGGAGGTSSAAGGNGGGGMNVAGAPGMPGAVSPGQCGGGGGGAAGRIIILDASGTNTAASGSIISPSIGAKSASNHAVSYFGAVSTD